ANGCGPSTTSVTITEPTALVATLVSTVNVSCNGGADGAITAGGSGGTPTYSFLWSTGGSTATETGLTAGTYTVTVTDANGCTDALTATVTEPLPLNAAIDSVQDVNCGGADGAIFTSAIGGTMPYTYAWSNGATTEDIMNLTAGPYTLTLTDANGCSTTVTGTVNQPTTLAASVVAVTDNLCNGDANGSIQAMATGGITPYTYSWSSGGMAAMESGLMAGTYTLTITDNNGCFVTVDTVVNEPAAVVFTLDSVQQVLCNGDSNGFVAVSTTGGVAPYTYAWSNGATMPVLTGLPAGVFTGTVTDANGCSETLSATITEPMELTGSVASTVQPLCFGDANGSATVVATGGTMPYTFVWPSGTIAATDSNLTAGQYAVTISDANGCTDQLTVNLTQPALLEVIVTGSNVTCAGDNDGTAMASISGGTFPFTYLWDDPAAQTTAMATGLLEGPVNVTITDANGCTASNGFTVGAANQLPTVSVTADKDTTCRDSAIVLDAGSGFQAYAWSTGASGQQISVDSSGSYQVTVTDNNG
ncbi:MAG: SprB repeat-containing protein, partial [Bacteroidota bacterium]